MFSIQFSANKWLWLFTVYNSCIWSQGAKGKHERWPVCQEPNVNGDEWKVTREPIWKSSHRHSNLNNWCKNSVDMHQQLFTAFRTTWIMYDERRMWFSLDYQYHQSVGKQWNWRQYLYRYSMKYGGRGGSVVEHRTHDRQVVGLNPGGVATLFLLLVEFKWALCRISSSLKPKIDICGDRDMIIPRSASDHFPGPANYR